MQDLEAVPPNKFELTPQIRLRGYHRNDDDDDDDDDDDGDEYDGNYDDDDDDDDDAIKAIQSEEQF